MSNTRFPGHARLVRIALCPLLLCLAHSAAAIEVDTNELARCAGLAAVDLRVACYDALAKAVLPVAGQATSAAHAPGAVSTTPSVAGSATLPPAPVAGSASPARAVPGTGATPPAPPVPATGSATPPPPTAVNPSDPAQFGLTLRQLKIAPGPESIKAVVSQITEDRRNNVSLVLDNGQTWTFIEPDPRVRPGDTVTIKRAALGSFLMFTPSRRSYRVERLN